MRGITLDFPGVRALDEVNLSVEKSEILALCGENGAGKSTLVKILGGCYPGGSFDGQIKIENLPVSFKGTREAEKAGISIIPQELALVRELSIGENLFLGREPKKKSGLIDWNLLHSEATSWLNQVGLRNVSSEEKIKTLGIGQQQLVEIAKAIAKRTAILILDEPTAALSEEEADLLFEILFRLKEKGITSIYISHKLKEVFRIADRIAVLRDGRTVATLPAAQWTEAEVVAKMVGRELKERFPEKKEDPSFRDLSVEKVLDVENFSLFEGEKPKLQNISFTVKRGEIVGVSGLMGAGRTELAMALFGVLGESGKKEGTVKICGRSVFLSSPREAIREGLFLVSEDRKRFGLVLEKDLEFNLTLSILDRLKKFFFLIDREKSFSLAEATANELQLKAPSLRSLANSLSGGNQQKVVLGKGLLSRPKLLILDEPTRGIDVGAKYEIYRLMRRLTEQGLAILMFSSELPEVLGMSDRVLVMREGRIVRAFEQGEATQEKVMKAATGCESE